MLLATLILEREPLRWVELPQVIINWLQSAGVIAALGLFLVFAVRASFSFRRLFQFGGGSVSLGLVRLGAICATLSWILFGALIVFAIGSWLGIKQTQALLPSTVTGFVTIGDLLLALAGGLSLAIVVFPVLRAVVFHSSLRRIGAVARLSVKESIRNRGVAVFGVMGVVFLFADWFIPYKPEAQLRNYVWVLYWTMFVLFLFSAAILGSFSIPNDIKNQTIHTVVTKPISKFEIVLGRFLGYGSLLTVSLFLMGVLSLSYVWRGLTDEARNESFLARVPVYGELGYINTKGESVGREWDYRKYIGGQTAGGGKKQYAVWIFDDLSEVEPRDGDKARFEFGFDIFRLTKGDENKGIFCTFKFADGKSSVADVERQFELRRQERDRRQAEARKQAGGKPVDYAELNPKIEADLLKEFPIFEAGGVEITDYHTLSVDVPFALIKHLRELERPLDAAGRKTPALTVYVNIDPDRGSAAQMLGVAPRDLYILAAEKNFYVNFLKGLVGLWMSTLMVLGVAICCSTYLSGVVSLLCTLFLFLAGFFMPSLEQMANNQGVGGGPAEAFSRIVTRNNMVTPLDESPSASVIQGFDELFRWQLRRILTLIPDASRYDLHPYVANGFDISLSRILFVDCFLPLVGYLLPWFVLAYYLINYREIANPT
ncbi:MAG: hypothetical protein WCL32_12885 [Planctomycetota bacterium]